MKKGVYSMYGTRESGKMNFYMTPQKEYKIHQQIQVQYTISKNVGKGITNQMSNCVREMVHFISAGLEMKG